MMKFLEGERVIFPYKGRQHLGRVTQLLPKKRRVVSDTGERVEVPVRQLKRAQDRVLFLESRLDKSLRSLKRSYGPMLKQWLEAYDGVEVLYEKVHTVEDLRLFLRQEGRKPGTRFIHYNGHGENLGATRAVLKMTFERLDLFVDTDVFAGLDGKVLLFSCCEVGANLRALERIKAASNAAAVIAYRTPVPDSYTNIAEALLYDRMIAGVKPLVAVAQVAEGLFAMGLRAENERKPVLVGV